MTYEEYVQLPGGKQFAYLNEFYSVQQKSIPEIATLLGTYANKVRREFKKLGIAVRNKKDAQSLAIKQGRSKHPTKNKVLSVETKEKIGASLSKKWGALSDEEKAKRAEVSRAKWNEKTDLEKDEFFKAAGRAVREAGVNGSKLEMIIYKFLVNKGYKVEFHKEQALLTQKLQLDLYLPDLALAIEVDGPSHTKPIWGDEALNKSQKSEESKNSQISAMGLKLIRIRSARNLNRAFTDSICSALLDKLKQIETSTVTEAIIYIGE